MLEGNVSWPNLLWDMGAKEKGWKKEERNGVLAQQPRTQGQRRKELPGEQGLGEGGLLLCAGGRNQENAQVPYGGVESP